MSRLFPLLIGLLVLTGCATEIPTKELSEEPVLTMSGCGIGFLEGEYVIDACKGIIGYYKYKICSPHDCYYTDEYTKSGECIIFKEGWRERQLEICGFYSLMPQ